MRAYTVRQVADALSVSTLTVYKWLWSGELNGYRLGRVWRISEEELKKFLKRRAKEKTQEEQE